MKTKEKTRITTTATIIKINIVVVEDEGVEDELVDDEDDDDIELELGAILSENIKTKFIGYDTSWMINYYKLTRQDCQICILVSVSNDISNETIIHSSIGFLDFGNGQCIDIFIVASFYTLRIRFNKSKLIFTNFENVTLIFFPRLQLFQPLHSRSSWTQNLENLILYFTKVIIISEYVNLPDTANMLTLQFQPLYFEVLQAKQDACSHLRP